MTKLPAPEQWAMVKMNEVQVAELIEKYIDYYDPETGRSVHLPMAFVRHWMDRGNEGKARTSVGFTTLPIVRADGSTLALDHTLDLATGILFLIPKEVLALTPRREDWTPKAVREAMQFLTEEWLCDVLADYAGKCMAIAAPLTIIERMLLPERPAFFVNAGKAKSGKSTLIKMLIRAVTGIDAAAAAWSPNEEERRKAILTHFMYGAFYILWDNIARGTVIRCPHIERSCTTTIISDRKLGVNELVHASAAVIHIFNGNNIGRAATTCVRAA
jgi:hypothetical protein